MRSVDVGVGHQDELAIAQLGGVEVVLADAAAQRSNHGANFFVAQHLVVAGLFDVENLALQRQDRLEATVAALLGSSAGRFTLDQVQFAAVRLALGAVGELARQAAAVQRAFTSRQVASLAGRLARASGVDGLVDDLLRNRRILFKERAQPFVDERLHGAGDVGIQLALGLPFELWLRQLDRDDDDQAFADVVAGEIFLDVLEQSNRLPDGVDRSRQSSLEAGKMGSAVDRIDVIGKAENRLGVGVVVLQRDLHGHAIALGFHVDRLVVEHLLTAVQMLDELRDTAGVLELLLLALTGLGIGGALVGKRDL